MIKQNAVDLLYINCWAFQMFETCLNIYKLALHIHETVINESIWNSYQHEIMANVEPQFSGIERFSNDFSVLRNEYEELEMGNWLRRRELYQPTPSFYGGGIWHFLYRTVADCSQKDT